MSQETAVYIRKKKGLRALRVAIAVLGTALLLLVCSLAFGYAFVKGMDKHFENQDRMFCESAKVSGNVHWLHKCECYYETGDIKCLKK